MAEFDVPLAGVLGAGGAVGRAAATTLTALAGTRIRLGARRAGAADEVAAGLGGLAEVAEVDASDPAGLASFCAGCQVVVNCTGSTAQLRASVAGAALAAGAHYVDPGGDESLRRSLAGALSHGQSCVLAAGVLPGLSALVPRWLARGLAAPLVLTTYLGTQDRMTPVSAAEFLLSLAADDGATHGMWRAGGRLTRALEPGQLSLPFFPAEVTAYPYFSQEAERLARRLPLDEASWYYLFEDQRIVGTLSRLAGRLRSGEPLEYLAAELVRAIDVEMFGRVPAQRLLFQLTGEDAGQTVTRVAVLRATSTYDLTGVVAALTVRELLRGALPPGAHFAADVLDPALVDALPGSPGLAGLHLLDQPLAAYEPTVQGTI